MCHFCVVDYFIYEKVDYRYRRFLYQLCFMCLYFNPLRNVNPSWYGGILCFSLLEILKWFFGLKTCHFRASLTHTKGYDFFNWEFKF